MYTWCIVERNGIEYTFLRPESGRAANGLHRPFVAFRAGERRLWRNVR